MITLHWVKMCEYLIEGLFHKSIRVKKMIGFGNFKSLKAVPIRSKFQLNTNPSKMSPKIVSRLVKTAVFKLVLSYSSVFFFLFLRISYIFWPFIILLSITHILGRITAFGIHNFISFASVMATSGIIYLPVIFCCYYKSSCNFFDQYSFLYC